MDALISDVQETFHAFLLAQTTLQLGGGVLQNIQDNVIVEATLGVAISIEPIPIGELRRYGVTLPGFLLEVFQRQDGPILAGLSIKYLLLLLGPACWRNAAVCGASNARYSDRLRIS